MSTYKRQTRNPITKKWENATWFDDYFGSHNYGVSFPSAPTKVYDCREYAFATRDNEMSSGGKYETKDSGERVSFASGFQRDTNNGKPRFDLIPTELLTRLADLYTRGAEKYDENNWRKAVTEKEINRFKESAWRHFVAWSAGEEDEDHGIAAIWNIMSYEWHVHHKMKNKNDK